MPRRSSQDLIDSGRKLSDMKRDEGYKLLHARIQELMAEHSDKVLSHRGPVADIAGHLYRHQGLIELLEWIEDEIEVGGRELLRQPQEATI